MNESCYLYINDKPVTSKMYEMWNNVSSKLEQVQQSQNQTQQPHTSSGSIKGSCIIFHIIIVDTRQVIANFYLFIHRFVYVRAVY